jgi:SAM-dependent methyltransferase
MRRPLRAARESAVRLFERLIGVQTYGDMLTSGWVALWALFGRLEVSRDDVFVDLGCGKGRVLYMAGRRPFKRVIGIEWSERFCQIARANLERNRHRLRCQNTEVVTIDLREWEVPDDVTVIYFFVSFPLEPEVVDRLISKLTASAERVPRRLRFISFEPLSPMLQESLVGWDLEPLRERVPFYLRRRFHPHSCMATLDPRRAGGFTDLTS